ncbi:MAG: SPOR domain-containing protein [Methylococcales bacterium]
MNPELKQRLIGAIVVTALAAIFIPMLFDDPIDNSGQSVTALNIPATPDVTGEVSANKLPTSADQVLNAPTTKPEKIVETNEEAELSASRSSSPTESMGDESGSGNTDENGRGQFDEPIDHNSANSLDTGVVGEKNKPPKPRKPKTKSEPTQIIAPFEQPVEKNTVIEPTAKPLKRSQLSAIKPIQKETQPFSADVINTEKPVNNSTKPKPEFNRWIIQAGTFSKKENAIALMETIHKQGLPATISTTNGPNNTILYRLKVGPTLDKKHAIEMKEKLDSQKIQSIIVGE